MLSGKGKIRENDPGLKPAKRLKRALPWAVALFAAAAAGLWLWSAAYRRADHTATLVVERSSLAGALETQLPDSAGKMRVAFELTDERGRRTRGELHLPGESVGRLPVILVLGGYGTGARAAGLVRLSRPALLCSIDYPAFEVKKTGIRSGLGLVLEVRRATLNAVAGIFNVLDYLSARPEADTSRITVVGASLGVPFAVIGAGLDERADALVLVYGAGDLARLIDWNLRRKLKFPPARFLLSRILSTAAAPFEPSAYIGRLMVNSRLDERIPEPCIHHLFNRAGEPKTMRWLATAHIHPKNRELIDSLTAIVSGWLEEKGKL